LIACALSVGPQLPDFRGGKTVKNLLSLVLLLPLSASAQSPFDGTWKMNLSSTQFEEKPDIFALQNGEYTCSTCIPKIALKADGADHKVAGDKDYDALAVKQVDDKTVQFTRKRGDKVLSESTDTVSPDGNTLTSEFKDHPTEGQPMTGKIIFTRGAPGPKGAHAISGAWRTAKVEDISEQGLAMTLKTTPDGLSMDLPFYHESYEAKFDGKEYPVKGEPGGLVSLKKVNDSTIVETRKRYGNTLAINEMNVQGNTMKVVSKDVHGNTMMSFTADKQY
jgi:hypothetical protein